MVLSLQSIIEMMPLSYTHCGSQLINQTLWISTWFWLIPKSCQCICYLLQTLSGGVFIERHDGKADSCLRLLKNQSHSLKYTSLVEFVLSEGYITLLDKILMMVFWPKEQTGPKEVCTFKIKEIGED